MALTATMTVDELFRNRAAPPAPSDALTGSAGAVSWAAVLAGATAAAALSLILLILGTGLGLSAASPWKSEGASAATLGATGILWITFTQVIAAAAGGYLAGRLRSRWMGSHPDEVYFRDTAHGFLAWAAASLFSAALLTTVIGSIISGGVQVGGTAVGSAAVGAASPSDYLIDSLFRRESNGLAPANGQPAETAQSSAGSNVEVARIFTHAIREGSLPAEDLKYVGQLVAARTGLPQADAEKRVTDRYSRLQSTLKTAETDARAIADKARKASAYVALWIFISLLMGAFASSLAATYGGRQRDL